MNPYFSVVMPVYNGSEYIVACLDSLGVARNHLPADCEVEVICVDDGSTDESGKLLDSYAHDHPWCKVIHGQTGGICLATNAGIDVAQGEWLSLVDQDDLVCESYFASFLQQKDKEDINFFAHERLLIGGEIVTNRLSQPCRLRDKDAIAGFVQKLIYNRTDENLFGYSWNKFIRRSLIESCGIRLPNLRDFMEYQDEIFTFEICHHAHSLYYSPVTHYRYRIGANNHSSRRMPRHSIRAKYETEIGDADGRFVFKSCAYMSAGMALLMEAYSSALPQDAYRTTRYLKAHQQYMIPVVVASNHLSLLARMPGVVLFSYLWAHGCGSTLKRVLKKAVGR